MITQARLRELLEYAPATGLWRWREWNSYRQAGWFAGAAGANGYLTIRIDDVTRNAHTLAWIYTYGAEPANLLDHKDQIRSNNKLENLRLTDRSANVINSKTRWDNTSGYPGISRDRGRYRAYINKAPHGRIRASFSTLEEAVAWRMQKEIELYGEFVPGV